MLRKDAETAVMRELAGELAHADQLQHELLALEGRLEAAHAPPPAALTARELAVRQLYAERIQRECVEARARSARQDTNVEQARLRLAHATCERRTLDQLEQRRRAAHDTEVRRVEAAEGNEISLLNHLRAEGASS
jgi:flagellar export protein FliJ